ncbi:hypothetical protein [Actinomadura sp. 6N118]|uniref:hypothetical protein n=1 Tax=Actinomadura sp. 6N118 TaxID=3375151 RepID=UPI0037BCC225
MAEQDRLLEQGRVVWGGLVQANTLLFGKGRHDSPAEILYSPDPMLDDRPDLLAEVAQRLFALKGSRQADAELQTISDTLANELEDAPHAPVPRSMPRSMAGSLPLFTTTVLVSRRHLPDGVLRGGLFPLIVHPELDSTMILPSRYWAPTLVQAWSDPSPVGRTAPARKA